MHPRVIVEARRPFIEALREAYPEWRVVTLVASRDVVPAASACPANTWFVPVDVWEKYVRVKPLPPDNGEPVLVVGEVSSIPPALRSDLERYAPRVTFIHLHSL